VGQKKSVRRKRERGRKWTNLERRKWDGHRKREQGKPQRLLMASEIESENENGNESERAQLEREKEWQTQP
jgi:hypothetical protein